MKILSVLGTRPEAIKMAPVINRLERTEGFQSRVCITGQHRELLDHVLATFSIQANYDLAVMREGQDLADVTSAILLGMREVLRMERPDRVLVHGDTTTALAASLAAFYERVPVAHVEAGLRTGRLDSPWPEELNRRMASMVADLHFAPTKQARKNLLREGVESERVLVTGNTVVDALDKVTQRLKADLRLREKLHHKYPFLVGERRRIVVTVHRRENQGTPLEGIAAALRKISEREDVELICPLHPNPNVREPLLAALDGVERIHLVEPLEYIPFIYLMTRADLILTDSGGIQEEAPILGKPVLLLRDITERPESVNAGTVKIVGTATHAIVSSVRHLLDDANAYSQMISTESVHGDGRASLRIVRALVKEGMASHAPQATVQRSTLELADI